MNRHATIDPISFRRILSRNVTMPLLVRVAGVGLMLLLDGALWFGLAALIVGRSIAWARVFLGVRFPLDMLGGVGVAACSYFIASPLWHRAGMAITGLAERLYRTVLARPISAGWVRR